MKVVGARFLAAILATCGLFAGPVPMAIAEDTCVADAPRDPESVVGHTWSGTVVELRMTGVREGFQLWSIVMSVDRVYEHRADRDFPPGAVLSVGSFFILPSDTCGRRGDMGMVVGQRYLVSAAFVAAEGTALGNLVVWRIDGDDVAIPDGLYQTTFVSEELTAVRTVDEALRVLGIKSDPTITPTEVPEAQASPASTGDLGLPLPAVLLAAVCVAMTVVVVYLVRRRSVS